MQKIRLICLKEDRADVVCVLHELGVIDLRKSQLPLSDDAPPSDFSEMNEALIKVEGALRILPKRQIKRSRRLTQTQIKEQLGSNADIDRIYALSNERQQLQEDIGLLNYAKKVATYFTGIDVDFGTLDSEVLSFRAAIAADKELSRLRKAERTQAISKSSEIVVRRHVGKNENLIFMAYKKGDEAIDTALKSIKFTELDLHAKYLDATPGDVTKRASKSADADTKRIGEIDQELSRISDSNYSKLSVLRESLEIEVKRGEASSVFKATDSTFALEGWIPKRRLDELRQAMHKASRNRFVLEELKTPHEELAPTLVKRPKFLKPFDYLVEFYSVPRSDEIDPTWIFIISFPIFYGIMVSDVGYGVASFILSWIIMKKTDPEGLMHNVAKIWRMSAIPAVIVGILSDQYFGFSLNHLFAPAFTGFSWFSDITTIIVLTIFFGIFQVCLGLLFGFVNELRHHQKKLAISKITGILTLVFGTIAVAGGFFHATSASLALDSAGIAVLMLLVTAALSGIEAAEITNLMTHPLSYARLMGFGLGSIIIAQLIDQGFTPHLGSGVMGIVIFVIYLVIFMLLHLLNMILSIFEGIVQGVRLNFVEFFSKFYKGSGVKYQPFEYKEVYTEK